MKRLTYTFSLLLCILTIVQGQNGDRTFLCPNDTTLTCDLFITPDITGVPTTTGYDSIFFFDEIIQSCPLDVIIERTWVAQADSSISDSCVQSILFPFDSLINFSIADTVSFDNLCFEELPSLLREEIEVPCNITVDSVNFTFESNSCDSMVLFAEWVFDIGCSDSVIRASQIIMVNDLIIAELSIAEIVLDTIDNVGSIDVELSCPIDSFTFNWSNGNPTLDQDSLMPGSYTLTITDLLGCSKDFEFEIESTIVDTTNYVLSCPSDTTISCNSNLMPPITGFAQVEGYDTLYYIDSIVDECPNDLILERSWIGESANRTDTCVQNIIQTKNGFELVNYPDTLRLSDLCNFQIEEVLANDSLNLSCGLSITNIRVSPDTTIGNIDFLTRGWTVTDNCQDSSVQFLQTIEITNAASVILQDIQITPDKGDTSGIINYNISCAPDSISFNWSNGTNDTTLTTVVAGDYTLVISDATGAIDSFQFSVPSDKTISIICPVDTTVSCDASLNTEALGAATATGADTLFFIDDTNSSCPDDLIITRQWIAQNQDNSDTCTQTITVLRNGLATIDVPDTLSFNNICQNELVGLLESATPSLGCDLSIDTTIITLDSAGIDFEFHTRNWTITDPCIDSTIMVSQTILVTDIQNFKIDNIVINPDNGDTTGTVSYDIICAPDSAHYIWSNGSTNATLSNVVAGEYSLMVSDNTGRIDSLNFSIPSDIAISINCPADTTISCDASSTPESLGIATATGADTLFFIDNINNSCPDDLIITRKWFAQNQDNIDSCTQEITVLRDGFSTINIADTLRFNTICQNELAGLLESTIPSLGCDLSIDTTIITLDSVGTDFEFHTRNWTITDPCIDSTIMVTQTILVTDIQNFKIDNIVITPDNGDSTGTISYDILCTPDSVRFQWSNGSTDTILNSVQAGEYSVIISNNDGRIDSLNFSVPSDKAISIICPVDTTVSCDASLTTEALGIATATGADTLFFIDDTNSSCPDDLIITRQWIAQNQDNSDTCTQTITVLRNGFATIDVPDTLSFNNICQNELAGLLESATPSLGCDLSIDTTIITLDSAGTDFEFHTRNWTITDPCIDSTIMVTQTILVTNIQNFKIDNIVINPDNGDTTGTVSYDIICAPDSAQYIWSNGSTNATLSNVVAGEYSLIVSDNTGRIDSLNFSIPSDIAISISCPADTTISCDASSTPESLGIATATGADTLFFIDNMENSCPDDLIITRQWFAQNENNADSCIQMIRLIRDGLSKINIDSTISLTGVCITDVSELDIELACGIILDTMSITIDSMSCDFATLTRHMTFTDECLDSSLQFSQSMILTDIPVAQIVSETITGDPGDGTGSIDLELDSCGDSLSFIWSNGTTTPSIDSLSQGQYEVLISNTMGCEDTLRYGIPLVDTTAFFITIKDRNGDLLDVDTIETFRASGGNIVSEFMTLDKGQYAFRTSQTLIRGDQICFDINQDAAIDLSVLDIIKAQRHVLGLELACEEDQLAGDINFSGNISGADLAGMQRVILALDSGYPSGRTWIFTASEVPNRTMLGAGCVSIEATDLTNRRIEVKGIKLGDFQCDE